MSFSLTWMPDVLLAAGLKVARQPGWESRGRGEMGKIRGVICHHTVGRKTGNMPSLDGLTRGVTQGNGKFLAGPLSQLGLGRDGTYYVIAAGRCNHAGEGRWQNVTTGNTSFIGIEAENAGTAADPWPDVQLDAYHRGVAAILKHVGEDAAMCCGHREYALPPGRKSDPHSINMHDFRLKVGAIMRGTAAVRPQIPAQSENGKPTLRRGSQGDDVRTMQRALRLEPDGDFGARTEAAVRAFQREQGLVPDGIFGPASWRKLPG
jgi:N-acetylmuramoyl-L-alanine amidase/Putative peptidoglycan binding domain